MDLGRSSVVRFFSALLSKYQLNGPTSVLQPSFTLLQWHYARKQVSKCDFAATHPRVMDCRAGLGNLKLKCLDHTRCIANLNDQLWPSSCSRLVAFVGEFLDPVTLLYRYFAES
jgi:hypothetical protein